MTTPAEVHAAAERARAREVGDVLAVLRAIHSSTPELPLTEFAERLHAAGVRATMPPAALTPWQRALAVRSDVDADPRLRDEVADRLLAAVRRTDGGPVFEEGTPAMQGAVVVEGCHLVDAPDGVTLTITPRLPESDAWAAVDRPRPHPFARRDWRSL